MFYTVGVCESLPFPPYNRNKKLLYALSDYLTFKVTVEHKRLG